MKMCNFRHEPLSMRVDVVWRVIANSNCGRSYSISYRTLKTCSLHLLSAFRIADKTNDNRNVPSFIRFISTNIDVLIPMRLQPEAQHITRPESIRSNKHRAKEIEGERSYKIFLIEKVEIL